MRLSYDEERRNAVSMFIQTIEVQGKEWSRFGKGSYVRFTYHEGRRSAVCRFTETDYVGFAVTLVMATQPSGLHKQDT